MEEKTISVIIPVYNVEKYLERCVESVIKQSYRNLQIILIDDGSKDRGGKICDDLAQKDNRISVFHKNWGGLADTRNIGLTFAKGEYVSFIDSDDYIHETMLEEMVMAIEKSGSDIAVCGRVDLFENSFRIRNRKTFCLQKEKVYEGGEILKEYFVGKDIEASSCCDKVFRYSIIENLRFPNGKTSEDLYFTFNAFKKAKKVIHVAKPLYFYCHRKDSISTKIPVDKSELDVMNLLKRIEINLWKRKNFMVLKAFYSFYAITFAVIYDEIRKSSKVDKSYRRYLLWLKIDAFIRFIFIVNNECVLLERKKRYIKMLFEPV